MAERPKVHSVHHIAIKTCDVERLVDFYVDLLGLEEIRRNVREDALYSVWLAGGDTVLMIERSSTEDPGARAAFEDDPPGLHLVAFGIDARERNAWCERFESARVSIVERTPYTLYVLDPDGNRIGLSSWPDGSPTS